MIPTPIIKSSPNSQGAVYQVVPQGRDYAVWLLSSDGQLINSTPAGEMTLALQWFSRSCRSGKLGIDWHSCVIPIGDLYCVRTISYDVEYFKVLHGPEAYDAFRRDRLTNFYDDHDRFEVMELLAAGSLDEAWDRAVSKGETNPASATLFGYHKVTKEQNFAPFGQLPDWLQNAVRAKIGV